jgi:hypothetical protein
VGAVGSDLNHPGPVDDGPGSVVRGLAAPRCQPEEQTGLCRAAGPTGQTVRLYRPPEPRPPLESLPVDLPLRSSSL